MTETTRVQARAQMEATILRVAKQHLAESGPAALSLRAVARDIGVVSSAVYKYVPNRDALLTLLIIDAYESLGAAATRAEQSVDRTDRLGRFVAVAEAVRQWALDHPNDYALIYGSPVSGYAAPQDTIAPAMTVPRLLTGILRDRPRRRMPAAPIATVSRAIAPLCGDPIGADIPDALLVRGLLAWSAIFGTVSFELFGHVTNGVEDGPRHRKALFHEQMTILATSLDLV